MVLKNVCIVGGGSLGHVIAGWLSNKGLSVNILTRRPNDWGRNLKIRTPEGCFTASLNKVSSEPQIVIPQADVVLLTVPGYANKAELLAIKPYLKTDAYVGGVFCSSGFFFEALRILPEYTKLWGFQRVPFISRTTDYGKEANLLGYRPEFNIAIEHAPESEKEEFRKWVEDKFGSKTLLKRNYLEVSITNSNPILHTARLYTMFADWDINSRVDHNILFYEEWTIEAAELLIKMDQELFHILEHLPVTPGYLIPLLEYYESADATSLKNKLSSISGLKGISSPMVEDINGWYPDFTNRYFTEDFGFSLRYIWELGKKYNVATPNIDKVYEWGKSKINQ